MAFIPFTLVAERIATRIESCTWYSHGATLVKSGYRLRLEDEPDSAVGAMYYVDVASVAPHARSFGTQENFWTANVIVQIGFYAGGGDLQEGDRQSVLQTIGDDVMRLADALENTDQYGGSATGIRRVIFQGAQRTLFAERREIWEVRFEVEWRSDWNTSGQ